MNPPATIDKLSAREAYQLGVLDERIRAAEQEREAFLAIGALRAEPAASAKPKKPKTPTPTVDDKQTEMPHATPPEPANGHLSAAAEAHG